jgi:hypothetical protein
MHFGQTWPGAVMMMGEHRATNARNIKKRQVAFQKAADGFLIGRVQHRAARPAPASDLIA